MKNEQLDVLIIGGGPAGMSAALVLGRAMINTVIISDEMPRNLVTQASHGFFTRDGYHPGELLRIAKKQLEQYETVEYRKGRVEQARQSESGYTITTDGGRVFNSKRLVFASGFRDNVSKIGLKGIEEVYGNTVYPCPFCDGWERRNEPLALFGQDEGVGQFAKTISNWTSDLVVFTAGANAISEEERLTLAKNKIRVIQDKIAELISENGKLQAVKLAGGELISRTGGFLFSTGERQATDIPAKLGVETGEWGTYKSNDWGKTDVEGLYIVGDAKNGFTGVIGAAAEGSYVAEMITQEIIDERWIV